MAAGTDRPDDPDDSARDPVEEPVWLVRIIIVLFLVGFAAFLAREVWRIVESFS